MLAVLRGIELGGYPRESVEIFVIDNCPSPETRAVCEHAKPGLPVKLHYVTEPELGQTHARNRAVSTALEHGADFVAFIDDDDEPQPDWLKHLLDRQAETGADIVFGAAVLDTAHMPDWARKSTIYQNRRGNSVKAKSKFKSKNRRYGLPYGLLVGNVLISRGILEKMSSAGDVFHHWFRLIGGEDKDFFIRAMHLDARIVKADKSLVSLRYELERYTVRGLLKRGFKNGSSRANMARIRGSKTRIAALLGMGAVKLLFFLALIPFSLFSKGRVMHNLYRVAKASGIIYTALTGRQMRYYARPSQAAPAASPVPGSAPRAGSSIAPLPGAGAAPVKAYSYGDPSPEYRDMVRMYEVMHAEGASLAKKSAKQTFPGKSLLEHVPNIGEMVRRTGANSILDYGAGKALGYQARDLPLPGGGTAPSIQEYWGVESIAFYDPGYEPYSARPERSYDGVISTDVLEHITEPDVPWVVEEMFGMAKRFVYANVACYPAVKCLPNGRNAHCTVKPPSWWAGLVHGIAMRHLDISYQFVMTTKTGPRRKMGFGRNRKPEHHLFERYCGDGITPPPRMTTGAWVDYESN